MESNKEGWKFRTVHTVGLLAGALGDGSHQNPNGEREIGSSGSEEDRTFRCPDNEKREM